MRAFYPKVLFWFKCLSLQIHSLLCWIVAKEMSGSEFQQCFHPKVDCQNAFVLTVTSCCLSHSSSSFEVFVQASMKPNEVDPTDSRYLELAWTVVRKMKKILYWTTQKLEFLTRVSPPTEGKVDYIHMCIKELLHLWKCCCPASCSETGTSTVRNHYAFCLVPWSQQLVIPASISATVSKERHVCNWTHAVP